MNQKGFNVKNSFNGNIRNNDKAWAVATQERQPHWARFKLEKPIGDAAGATFNFSLMCRYSKGEYPLGKFRIWVTRSNQPLDLGLPENVAAAVKTSPTMRNKEQTAILTTYYQGIDLVGLKISQKLVSEKRPLPSDPKMAALKAVLVKAELPVPENEALVRLRRDVGMSIEQSANKRLTAAQDVTWALINNPAFLFNR